MLEASVAIAGLEQLLLAPLSVTCLRLKEWREWGIGSLHPFC